MTITNWHKRAICPCGWHTYAPFGNLFHVRVECCPKCGSEKGTYHYKYKEHSWIIETMRWFDHSVWYKPSTWGKGVWQKKSDE